MDAHSKERVVSAQHLSKTFSGPQGELSILKAVELEVYSGEAVAILGASGSGKSTLLGLLAGLDTTSTGAVTLFGQPLNTLDEDQRARLRAGQVGFVFQSFQLLPGLTALENVMLPLELNGEARSARQRARETLDRVGLAAREEHYPAQLSGGEQQRVAIARAFVVSPKILFADEPTGNLDQATGQMIIELLFALRDGQATALVLVTHDQQLARFCDRRFNLQAGTLEPL